MRAIRKVCLWAGRKLYTFGAKDGKTILAAGLCRQTRSVVLSIRDLQYHLPPEAAHYLADGLKRNAVVLEIGNHLSKPPIPVHLAAE